MILDNVYFYYTKIQEPVPCFDKAKGKEFAVDVLVTEDQAKVWNKAYKKQKAKTYTAQEFEENFKEAPPYESEDDEYHVLTVRRKAQYADGNPLKDEHKPKVFIKNSAGKLESTKILISNGASGALSYEEYEGPKDFPGIYARLKAIRCDKYVEYKKGGSSDFSELGEVEGNGSEFEVDSSPAKAPTSPPKAQAAPTPKVAAKKAPKPVVEADSEEFEDSPFS